MSVGANVDGTGVVGEGVEGAFVVGLVDGFPVVGYEVEGIYVVGSGVGMKVGLCVDGTVDGGIVGELELGAGVGMEEIAKGAIEGCLVEEKGVGAIDGCVVEGPWVTGHVGFWVVGRTVGS